MRERGERCAIHGGHKSCQLETTAGSHNFPDQARVYTYRPAASWEMGEEKSARHVKEHEGTNVSKVRRRSLKTHENSRNGTRLRHIKRGKKSLKLGISFKNYRLQSAINEQEYHCLWWNGSSKPDDSIFSKSDAKNKEDHSFSIEISLARKLDRPPRRSILWKLWLVRTTTDNADRRAYLLDDHWRRNPTSLGAAECVEPEVRFLG